MPEGYRLVAIEDGSLNPYMVGRGSAEMLRGTNGTIISVLPAADVAPSTQVVVSGNIRTVLLYEDNGNPIDGDGHFDVQVRGRLVVEGTTETAVGKVFVHMRIQGGDPFDDDDGAGDVAVMNEAYGTWEFMPGWVLLAGRIDNTAAVQAGIDWVFNFGSAAPGITNAGVEQMRLTYTTGPISWAIAVEDTENVAGADQSDLPAFAGYFMYNQDGLLLQVTGVWQEDDAGDDDDWFIGAGADFTLSDIIRFTGAVGFSEGYGRNSTFAPFGVDDEYWGASVGVIVTLQEGLSAEVGAGYQELDPVGADDEEAWAVTAGLYWTPVDQLTLGWQAEYVDPSSGLVVGGGDPGDSNFVARFATYLRF
jgi:hypothetical protein